MIELFISWLLATGNPEPVRCVVREAEAPYTCVLWYDPNTGNFYDKEGNRTNPPW